MRAAILTDIEGTTSSLSFVKEVLFPYARERLPAFVHMHRDEPRVRDILDEVRAHQGDRSLDEDTVVRVMCRWIDEDRKITPLKTLQGLIWEQGYRGGSLRGHVYDDAVERMRVWRDAGHRLFVFSSGSETAQRLLFEHSTHGNLAGWFSGFFDTRIGPKREASSYVNIAVATQVPPAQTLFLSDTIEELDAARAAGMNTTWLNRGGDTRARGDHREARTFADVDPFVS